MAHECDGCGSVCYCGGDIDDMLMIGTREALMCGHCDDAEDVDEDGYWSDLEVEIEGGPI